MILKSYELKKINIDKNKIILFYGKNEGHKSIEIDKLIKKNYEIFKYDEKELIENQDIVIENILSKSLFQNDKMIIISRATDKLLKIIELINSKNLDDTFIVINASNLEKKSKLRLFFEKEKNLICVPFYDDSEQTLLKIAIDFLKEKKISIGTTNINLIVNRSNGDRQNLLNELKKIESFCLNGNRITTENISKLTNLVENHSISELINVCLAKNKKKTIHILNENNFSQEDSILIIRSLLSKLKKILLLSIEYRKNKNIDLTIASARPPIFWKDKEITKLQLLKWQPEDIKKTIYKLNQVELNTKKNLNNSINYLTDFILDQSTLQVNN